MFNQLNSYQHYPDDERSNGGIEIGVHGSQRSSFIIELPTPVIMKRQSQLVYIFVVTVSVGIAWFASNGLLSTRRRDSHGIIGDECSSVKRPGIHLNCTEGTDEDVGHIPELIWSDEFNGDQIDTTKWTFVNGNGCDFGLCGWGEL